MHDREEIRKKETVLNIIIKYKSALILLLLCVVVTVLSPVGRICACIFNFDYRIANQFRAIWICGRNNRNTIGRNNRDSIRNFNCRIGIAAFYSYIGIYVCI